MPEPAISVRIPILIVSEDSSCPPDKTYAAPATTAATIMATKRIAWIFVKTLEFNRSNLSLNE
ncbi:MAG: hypothetical protein PVH73_03165 [Candidatus Bathyarchaeota archaeon]